MINNPLLILTIILLIGFLSGRLLKYHLKKRKVKVFSASWTNSYLISLIILLIIYQGVNYLLFDKKPNLSQIVGGILFLVYIYFYFRVIAPFFSSRINK